MSSAAARPTGLKDQETLIAGDTSYAMLTMLTLLTMLTMLMMMIDTDVVVAVQAAASGAAPNHRLEHASDRHLPGRHGQAGRAGTDPLQVATPVA